MQKKNTFTMAVEPSINLVQGAVAGFVCMLDALQWIKDTGVKDHKAYCRRIYIRESIQGFLELCVMHFGYMHKGSLLARTRGEWIRHLWVFGFCARARCNWWMLILLGNRPCNRRRRRVCDGFVFLLSSGFLFETGNTISSWLVERYYARS